MQNSIRLIDNILLEAIGTYGSSQEIPLGNSQVVRTVLADWHHGESRVEKHSGFRWVAEEWWKLKSDGNHQVWKTCFLGFEAEDTIRSETEIGRMVLAHDGVIYLQIPLVSGQDIRGAVTNLSEQPPFGFSDDMIQWLDKMTFYETAAEWLHGLGRSIGYSGKDNADYGYLEGDIISFNKLKKQYPGNLTDMLLPITKEIAAFINSPQADVLENLRVGCNSLKVQVDQKRIK